MLGVIAWILISPPNINFDYDDPKTVLLECKSQNFDLIIDFAYSMFLVVLCTIYAIKTRKIPENFNETKFIGFTCYRLERNENYPTYQHKINRSIKQA